MTRSATPDFRVRIVDRKGIMDDLGRISPMRRVVLAVVALAGITLTATSVVHPVATHPNVTSTAKSSPDQNQLTAAQNPPALPARGAGASTTGANPANAGKAGAASITSGPNSIPSTALAAYRKAAATLAVQDASCHLTWPILAGIGKVETDHGRSWGAKARITATGEVVPTILGPVLNGHNGTALVLDTDGGAYDHNRQFDRAVGPMQFVPATWAKLGRDGNGDGIKDPNNIWDATLAAGGYLCGGHRDLSRSADLRAAILSYNPSSAYVKAVLAWARAYAKAGANLPALDGVPDPLVLGAGGTEGEDPFGDPITFSGSGDFPDLSDPNNAFGIGDPNQAPNLFGDGGMLDSPVTGGGSTPGLHPSPSPTPSPTHSPSSSHSPSPSPSGSHSPSPSPSGSPSPSPSPSHTPTPTPTPSHTPTPTPTPTPTGPTCADPGVTATPAGAVTAVPVDTTGDGVNDVLRVTVPLTTAQAAGYTVGVRLIDADGLRVTSLIKTVSLAKGSQSVVVDLPGQDIGDAGASGAEAVRVTVRKGGSAVTCAHVIFGSASVGNVDASTFDGWFTTLDRLNQRLAEDLASNQVTGAAATKLPADLQTPTATAPDLATFRTDVAGTQVVMGQEIVRLDSLAARLIAQGSAAGSPTTLPLTDNVAPSADGVG